MAMLMFEADDADLSAILPSVKLMAKGGLVQIWTALLPGSGEAAAKQPGEDEAFEALAQDAALAIRPTPNRKMRKEAIEFLRHGDTFWDQQGEPDPGMRNALGALSKSLRKLFPLDASPIDRLATRKKHYSDIDHGYLGTRYLPTKLGERVYEILKEQNHVA